MHDLTHVINFNLPDEAQNYVHRSGRTGRAGKQGISIAIIHTREGRRINEIEKSAGISFRREPVPTGKEVCSRQLLSLIDKIQKVEVDESQIGPFLPEIYKKLGWLDREQLIKHFVSAEFNRFLSYYKGAKDINVTARGRDQAREEPKEKRVFAQFFINLGTGNHLNPAKLIGVINEYLGTNRAGIGRIEIHKKYSLFEIEESFMTKVMSAMNGARFGGTTIQLQLTDRRVEMPQKNKKPARSSKRKGTKRGYQDGKGKGKKGRKRW